MDSIIYWVGFAHLAVYAIGGLAFAGLLAFEFGFNRFIKRLGIGRDLVKMYGRYLKEKRQDTDRSYHA